MATKRTTLRSSKGKKLYAVRDGGGKFKDIQTYKRAHGGDVKRKSAAETKAAGKTVARKAAKKSVAKKAAKKSAPKKAAKRMPAKKAAARRMPARKAAAKRTPARKTAAKRTPAKKAAAKRAPAKKTARKPIKKAPVKKAPAKKAPVKQAARKPAARRAPAPKTAVERTVTRVKQAAQAITEAPMVEKASQATSNAMDSAKSVVSDMAQSVTGMMKSVAAKAAQVVDDVKDAAQRVTSGESSSS